MLKGEEEFREENEEGSLFETETPLVKEPLPVVYNPKIPIETFDFIVVDECHRSIYNLWRQVLEYFDAFLIGLTATPTDADHRLLQRQPGAGLHPRAGRRRWRQRRLRRVPHRDADHQGRGQAGARAGRLRPAPRPPHQEQEVRGARRRPDLHRQPARPRRGGREPDPARRPHVPRQAAGDLPRPHRGAQDARLRQDRPARRGHRPRSSGRSSARATTSARRSPSKTHRQEARRAAGRVPQRATTRASPSRWT